jgi:hypothetical protein
VAVVSSVDSGEGELGLAQSDVTYLAYRRGIDKNLYPHKNLRRLRCSGSTPSNVIVRADSRFQSIRDLKHQRVGVIRPGTSGEFSTRIVLRAHHMEYADVTPIFEPTDTLMPMLAKGGYRSGLQRQPADARHDSHAQQDRTAASHPDWPRRSEQPAQQLSVSCARSQWQRIGWPDKKSRSKHSVRNGCSSAAAISPRNSSISSRVSSSKQLRRWAKDHGGSRLDRSRTGPRHLPDPLHAGAARYYREREIPAMRAAPDVRLAPASPSGAVRLRSS